MIQRRPSIRELRRTMDRQAARKDPAHVPKGIAAGGLIGAMIWGLIAVLFAA